MELLELDVPGRNKSPISLHLTTIKGSDAKVKRKENFDGGVKLNED